MSKTRLHVDLGGLLAAALLFGLAGACGSIGPDSVPRDRSDYAAAIGDSWKQQTLLNIVKLRYGDFPVFVEIAQVIAGYQLQTTVAAGLSAQNYIPSAVNVPAAIGGTAAVGATYIDRPTVIYAPLTGNDFIKKLMSPVPPSAVLFLLQSGYSALVVMPLTVDSINGLTNESRRPGMSRPADPRFLRLTQLLFELQQANALQIQIERSKNNTETVVVGFPPVGISPDLAAKIAEVRALLHLVRPAQGYAVRYGGYSGKSDEIAISTRSMLQLMLELGVLAQVPEVDVAAGKAVPGATSTPAAGAPTAPLLNILSGTSLPSEVHVAVPYKGRWFWISDNDVRSKLIFGSVMLLFSISDVGVRSAPPVVTVPAN
jgi:hypothetical protein